VTRKQHGYGGHFVAWEDCLFRLHTSVNGRYRISTVGDWRPSHRAAGESRLALDPVTIGVGRLFDAEIGHESMVRKWEGHE